MARRRRPGPALLILGVAAPLLLPGVQAAGPAPAPAPQVGPKPAASDDETYQKLAHDFARKARQGRGIDASHAGIGDLVTGGRWDRTLALGDGQKRAIARVSDLVNAFIVQTDLARSIAYHGSPAAYQAFLEQGARRERSALRHAAALVRSGLLTEEQEALVIQRSLITRGRSDLYANLETWTERLDLSADQRARLRQVQQDAKRQGGTLVPLAFSKAPDAVEQYRGQTEAIRESHEAAAWNVLTADQQARWAGFAAPRPDRAAPPVLPEPTPAELAAATAEILRLAPTLRLLAEHGDELGLSPDQRDMADRLMALVRLGWTWIGCSAPDAGPERIRARRATFLRHAELLAQLAILTGPQAISLRDQTAR